MNWRPFEDTDDEDESKEDDGVLVPRVKKAAEIGEAVVENAESGILVTTGDGESLFERFVSPLLGMLGLSLCLSTAEPFE